MIVADNFEQFGRAVRNKLVREVSGLRFPSTATA
jgi:hypothetical protein